MGENPLYEGDQLERHAAGDARAGRQRPLSFHAERLLDTGDFGDDMMIGVFMPELQQGF